jgi:uncharacterized protein YrrD
MEWSNHQISPQASNNETVEKINLLNIGDIITIDVIDEYIKKYGMITSDNISNYDDILIVESIKTNEVYYQGQWLHVIKLRNIYFSEKNHKIVWILTSDGYIRDLSYNICGIVSNINIQKNIS